MNPTAPRASGWSSGNTPLPWKVVAPGMTSVSAKPRRGGPARALLHALRKGEVDLSRPFGLGQLERLADNLRHRAGRRRQRGPLGDRREHRHQVHALVRLLEAAG